ncbi:MAG: hypothetical protein LC127_07555 [Chitinophagales bacterium]|nr:hypothetical protein [Chitinophagales bacterium]
MAKYNFHLFDIKSQLDKELADFFDEKITIGGTKYNTKKGYQYNQFDTINLIEFVGASKFEKGGKDSEGQDKIYLNNSVFRADVASKQIDIDVSNFVFIPDDDHSHVGCVLARKKFKRWAKDYGLGIQLNDMVEKYPFYGSLVLKKRGKEFDIVPLSQLRNQQDAKDLNTASYVIVEHQMKAWEAQAMPNWNLSGLEYKWDDDFTVYERYARVPMQFFDAEADETESVDTVSFIVYNKVGKKENAHLLFIEQITDRPFKECHWKRRNGRWLGVGEIENNFENQKARNAGFNMRLRSTLWSSKNIFQSADETVAKNLVSEVRDGDVLTVTQAGIVSQINTSNKALADYNATEEIIEKNSDQKSFTYEVATGEQLQSGTPFRLGVLLSNSVESHFGLKREKLVLMFKEFIYDFIFPDFEKELAKEGIEHIAYNDESFDELVKLASEVKKYEFVKKSLMEKGYYPSEQEIQTYEQAFIEKGRFDIQILKNELKNLKYSVDIIVDGESVDINKKIETLTNLYTSMVQRGDPRAEKVLEKIIMLTGEKLPKQSEAPAQNLIGKMDINANIAPQNEQTAI